MVTWTCLKVTSIRTLPVLFTITFNKITWRRSEEICEHLRHFPAINTSEFRYRGIGVIRIRARAEPDGTCAATTFRLSPKRTSPFKSAGESVQSTAGSRGVGISVSNAGYTTFRGRVWVLATHSIRQFPLHFPSRASPCATTFRTQYTGGGLCSEFTGMRPLTP
jgi:hypothetical protein